MKKCDLILSQNIIGMILIWLTELCTTFAIVVMAIEYVILMKFVLSIKWLHVIMQLNKYFLYKFIKLVFYC